MRVSLKKWTASGEPWIWLNAGAVAISLIMTFGLLLLIAVRGLSHFWPHSLVEADYVTANGQASKVIGEIVEYENVPAEQLRTAGVSVPDDQLFMRRNLVKLGNRDLYGADFRWIIDDQMQNQRYPDDLVALERREWGNFYGRVVAVKEGERAVSSGPERWAILQDRLRRAEAIHDEIYDLERGEIGSVNYALERLRLEQRRLELDGQLTPEA